MSSERALKSLSQSPQAGSAAPVQSSGTSSPPAPSLSPFPPPLDPDKEEKLAPSAVPALPSNKEMRQEVGALLADLARFVGGNNEATLPGEADPLRKRTLKLAERALRAESTDETATILGEVALLYHRLRKYAEAEMLHKGVLAFGEKFLGPDHPQVARTLNNLSVLYRDLGRYTEAEPLCRRSLEIVKKTWGPEHPKVTCRLRNLADIYMAQGKLAEAAPPHQGVLESGEKSAKRKHPAFTARLRNYVHCLRRIRQMEILPVVLLVLLVLGGLSAGFRDSLSRRVEILRPRELKTVLPGKIQPFQTITVSSELAGKVASIKVLPGKEVTAGQLLAEIENTEVADELQRAQARLQLAESRLEEIRLGAPTTIQEQNAARARQATQERLALFSIEDAELAYTDAVARSERIHSLLNQHLATMEEFEQSQARGQAELRNLKAAREHQSRLKEEDDLAASQARLAQLHSKTNKEPQLMAAQMEREEAKVSLRAAQRKLEARKVTAPRAGVVISASVHAGDPIWYGSPLFQIVDLSQLRVIVPVTVAMARLIRNGSPVVIRMPTDPPQEMPATVSAVVLVPDPSGQVYHVEIAIPNPKPGTILVGLNCGVEFPHGVQ